jgi:GTPase SAR1 family protein
MNKELLYELMIEDDATDEVFAVSFVESPAIERDFVFFGKEVHFQAVDDEKRLVAGPLLIPNKKILRFDGLGNEYFVYFSEDTVEKLARKFLMKKYNDSVTVEHEQKVKGVNLVESWVIEQSQKDKSNIYGYTLPKKTWFGIYKVENEDVWKKVKDGTFKGFSVEALVEHRKSDLKLSLEKQIKDLTEEEAKKILETIHSMLMGGELMEAQPSITSTYPGEVAKKKKKDDK